MPDYSREYYCRFIGRRIRSARTLRLLTLAELAEQTGILEAHLQSYESGNKSISVAKLELIAAVLRTPVSHYMGACVLCGAHD